MKNVTYTVALCVVFISLATQTLRAGTTVTTNVMPFVLDGNEVMLGYVIADEPFSYEFFYGCEAHVILSSTLLRACPKIKW